MASDAQVSPMMAQYRRIKSELPKDALLLFRLGDFYELFFEDAQIGAQLLNVALTKRGVVPMCGIPFHAANAYLGRLLRAGRKVAICDQMEDARPGQLVKRQVTQILSPGTHFDERMLAAERNNFLAAVYPVGSTFGLACADLTTGDFQATELEGETALLAELERLRPAEIIYPSEAEGARDLLRGGAGQPSRPPAVGQASRLPAEVGQASRLPTGHPALGPIAGQTPAKAAGTAAPPGGGAASFGWILNGYDDWVFAPETAQFTVRDHLKVASLDGFGLKDRTAAIGAVGAVLHYLTQHLRRDAANLTRISFYQRSDYLALDFASLRHLEILEPLHPDAPRNASLYGALNRTVTPMGARRLRDWLSQPLAAVAPIERRQEAVQALLDHPAGLEGLRAQLEQVRDLERTLGRLSAGAGNARDLLALRLALAQFPGLKATLQDLVAASARRPAGGEADASLLRAEAEGGGRWLGAPAAPAGSAALGASRPAPAAEPSLPPLLDQLAGQVTALPDLEELIARAVVDEPPLALKEGGLIRDGFDAGLDELRAAMRGGKDWIAKLQQDEITRTGIQSLKVRFNSVFGYYIEVTKANLGKVPPHYLRKQTIANGERFITPALKEMEGKILGAEERSVKLEYELFQQVREAVLGRLAELLRAAAALAQLDVLGAFAQTARLFNYCRPQLDSAGGLVIRDGRHPVLEQTLREERFVPNDTRLEGATQIALITGPNMAGKSTYIRQVALLTLLAHTGAFIPAAEARIGLVDRIFTRIGASDDLARGQSTFMVEMCETAYILHHATPRSLIILDELGRGTSTFDGLSLAWSILEHLHNQVGAKTLFATHYHELTELAARLPRLKNYNVAVREWHDQIVFLRKIVEGGTDKSYGLQVARMAGVPSAVLQRAKEILRNLEESELTPEGNVRQATRRQRDRQKLQQLAPPPQLDLFG
ncbi:MAG: DNA mismatch repair protein MutS [Verrucomicrobiota bacterium]|jgi:DNA mismatch repair protein MutS